MKIIYRDYDHIKIQQDAFMQIAPLVRSRYYEDIWGEVEDKLTIPVQDQVVNVHRQISNKGQITSYEHYFR